MNLTITFKTVFLGQILSALAFGDFAQPNPQQPDTLFWHDGYDYAPSVYQETINGIVWQYFWWCGHGTWQSSNGAPRDGDVIYHRTWNSTSGWSSISKALTPNPDESQWDSELVCDPAVVRGQFKFPVFGLTTEWAMFYTATNDRQHFGINNKVGLAYSFDGTSWYRYPYPVLTSIGQIDESNPQRRYGVGQVSAHNLDGQARIRVFYSDSTYPGDIGQRVLTRTSQGQGLPVAFDAPVLVTLNGASVRWNTDFAYDSSSGRYYAAIPDGWWPGALETPLIGLFRINGQELISGAGTWEFLGQIDTSLTGFWENHSPGILHNRWGDVASLLGSGLRVYYSGGDSRTPGPTTWSQAYVSNGGQPPFWDLSWARWTESPSTQALNRYVILSTGRHWVTTGNVPPAWKEQTLGYVRLRAPLVSGHQIYSCQSPSDPDDHWLSKTYCPSGWLGSVGWTSAGPTPAATIELFSCFNVPGDHFVSADPGCEGRTTLESLGFVSATPQP